MVRWPDAPPPSTSPTAPDLPVRAQRPQRRRPRRQDPRGPSCDGRPRTSRDLEQVELTPESLHELDDGTVVTVNTIVLAILTGTVRGYLYDPDGGSSATDGNAACSPSPRPTPSAPASGAAVTPTAVTAPAPASSPTTPPNGNGADKPTSTRPTPMRPPQPLVHQHLRPTPATRPHRHGQRRTPPDTGPLRREHRATPPTPPGARPVDLRRHLRPTPLQRGSPDRQTPSPCCQRASHNRRGNPEIANRVDVKVVFHLQNAHLPSRCSGLSRSCRRAAITPALIAPSDVTTRYSTG